MIEVKSTLAGLAEALNALLAKGVDPEAVVEMCILEEDRAVWVRFDGFVDVEMLGAIPERKARVLLSFEEDPE